MAEAPTIKAAPSNAPVLIQTNAAPSVIAKILPPLAWLAVGFAVGYYQGHQGGKRKAATNGTH